MSATECRVCGEINPVGHDCKARFDALRVENVRLRSVLMKIEDLTDKGTAIIFPEATLKEIQKIAGDALDDDEVLVNDDNGLRLDGN